MSEQPIYDEAVKNATPVPAPKLEDSPPQTVPLESDSKGFIPSPENPDEGKVLTNHDEEDVDAALGRETSDGPGFGSEDDLPAEDFDSFADVDVEKEES